jgi:hypothetical protein
MSELQIMNIKLILNEKSLILSACKEEFAYSEDGMGELTGYLGQQFEEFNKKWLEDSNATVKLFFDAGSISSFQAYKISKKLYPFFNSQEEITKNFVSEIYILCQSYLLRAFLNTMVSQKKPNILVHFVDSFDELIP